MPRKVPVILPVETQARELDAKLLLGLAAAEAGHDAYVGFQNEIRARITAIPPGVFIAKGFASRKARFLRILRRLGFTVTAWDEEGLVHPAPEIYYRRRISPESLKLLDGLYSWGPDYTRLVRAMPAYDGTPIHEVGNPRIDLLRREVRGYFDEDVAALRRRFGRYILLNSNFGRVNTAVKRRRDDGVAGKRTDPALDQRWREMIEYRRALYQHFRVMLAHLGQAFPDHAVVLRPHPSERIESWHDIQASHSNVHVLFEGNVIPWLMGAEILVHNGCTTAIESVLLDKPVIAYQPITSETHDWALPNSLSHPVGGLDELTDRLRAHLDGSQPFAVTPAQRSVLDDFVAFDEQRLASDHIVESITREWQPRVPAGGARMLGWLDARARAVEKRMRALLPGDIYAPWHQDKQFPPIPLSEIQSRIARFARATGRFQGVAAHQEAPKTFRLSKNSR